MDGERKTKVVVKTIPAKLQQQVKPDGSTVSKISPKGKVEKTKTKWANGVELTLTSQSGGQTSTFRDNFRSPQERLEWIAQSTGVTVESLRNLNNT